jgi:hypothetical protein
MSRWKIDVSLDDLLNEIEAKTWKSSSGISALGLGYTTLICIQYTIALRLAEFIGRALVNVIAMVRCA